MSLQWCWSLPGHCSAAGAAWSYCRSLCISPPACCCLPAGKRSAAFGLQLPAEYDPLHRLRGWRDLGREVGAALAAHPGLTLFADDRELLAALDLLRPAAPLRRRQVATGADMPKDQWDLTNSLPKHRGGNFLLVSEHELVDEMRPSFASIDRLRPIVDTARAGGRAHLYALHCARLQGLPSRSLSPAPAACRWCPRRAAPPSPAAPHAARSPGNGLDPIEEPSNSSTICTGAPRQRDQDIVAGVVIAVRDQAVLPRVRAEAYDRDPAAERVVDFAGVDPACRRDDQPRPVEEAAIAELLSQ